MLGNADMKITLLKRPIGILPTIIVFGILLSGSYYLGVKTERSRSLKAPSPQFYENLSLPTQDTTDLVIAEGSATSHAGPRGFSLHVLVKKEAELLPEKLQLLETTTNTVNRELKLYLAQYQLTCGVANVTVYETEMFELETKLPLTENKPFLGEKYRVRLVYQDKHGKRLMADKLVERICFRATE